MKFNKQQSVIAAFVACLFIAPMMWMMLDRDPPYIRDSGAVVPSDPENCGISGGTDKEINPGDCVTVNWRITTKRNCVPNVHNNVTRRITDSEGVIFNIAPIVGLFGTTPNMPRELSRHFQIPSSAAAGRAIYYSAACFACNPLQHLFFPICVDKPALEFDIAPPLTRFPSRSLLPNTFGHNGK